MKKEILSAAMMAACALQVFPWGQKGHDTTCYIAECHLTPVTKAAAEELLGGKSIVYFANWLDNASNTPEYRYSKTWHYKNVDADETFDYAPLLETGDVVTAIRDQVKTLTDSTASANARSLALKMLVHLVGDAHQPMHLGHRSDRGGNQWVVKYFRQPTNIHSIWDSKLVESAHKWSYTEWQQQIDRLSPEEQAIVIAEGSPEKWGKETWQIATDIYNSTKQNSDLSYDYIAQWTPVVEQQFVRGGLRLADLLNSIFDPGYTGANIIVNR